MNVFAAGRPGRISPSSGGMKRDAMGRPFLGTIARRDEARRSTTVPRTGTGEPDQDPRLEGPGPDADHGAVGTGILGFEGSAQTPRLPRNRATEASLMSVIMTPFPPGGKPERPESVSIVAPTHSGG
jgi:hypothetical protein